MARLLPHAAWNSIHWWLALVLAGMLAQVAVPLGMLRWDWSGRFALGLQFALSALFLVGMIGGMVSLIRLGRRLRAAEWRLCPDCGHDLRGLPELEGAARCPECGREVTRRQLRAEWAWVFKVPAPPSRPEQPLDPGG